MKKHSHGVIYKREYQRFLHGDGLFKPVIRIFFIDIDVARFTEYESVRFRFGSNQRGDKFLFMEARIGESKFSIPLHHSQKSNIPKSYGRYYDTWILDDSDIYPNILKLYIPSNSLVFFEKDGWPMIKLHTWMGEGLLLLEPLSENLARIAGSGEVISLNNYDGLVKSPLAPFRSWFDTPSTCSGR